MTRNEKAGLREESRERRRRPAEDSQHEKPRRALADPPRAAGGDEFAKIAAQARELLLSLRGVEAESISAIGRTPHGWKVALEVVELRRIPDSTDVLASYEVELDGKGGFLGFERGARYNRSQAEGGAGR